MTLQLKPYLALLVALVACTDTEPPSVAETAPRIAFTDVTEAAGLGGFRHHNGGFGQAWAPEIVGGGGGFIDYDGDGWLDILLMGGGHWDDPADPGYRALWLYRNNGDGTFADQTEAAGLADVVAYTIGLAVADYDNDGDQDFVLMNLGENMLFRTHGGVFTVVATPAAPLPEECHLVVRGDEIAGRVTSIAQSPTLGCAIGLAYVAVDQATPGDRFTIKGDGGDMVEAVVTPLPFYDPKGERQKL